MLAGRGATAARRPGCWSSTAPGPSRPGCPRLVAKLDLDELAPVEADRLELNDIGRVRIRLAAPVLAEDYSRTRHGGSFLLIDPQTKGTLAAGLVRGHVVFGDDFTANDAWQI